MFRCIFPFDDIDDVEFSDFIKAKEYIEEMSIPSVIKSKNDKVIGFWMVGEFYYYH
mgnify:CR=1 FL=1|jgi:hypothetical protein